ncbi:MAG: SGNH/GDSL hydrolase family protein [Bacteroidota bacterium]
MEKILFFCVSLISISLGCSDSAGHQPTEDSPPSDSTINILYVGNSLTYTNDIPVLVQELGKKDLINVSHSTLLFPNSSIEDHLLQGKVQSEISSGKYDVVVAQQGPSALPESQVILLRDTKALAELCSATAHTTLALYMVWPAAERSFDLDNVIYSYQHAADVAGVLLCPAGLAWKIGWQFDATLPLYSKDNFHPSITGSVLAALTIYGTLAKKEDFNSIHLDEMSWRYTMTEERFMILKQSALIALNNVR